MGNASTTVLVYPSFLRGYIAECTGNKPVFSDGEDETLCVVGITACISNDPIEQMIGYLYDYLGDPINDTDRILMDLSEKRLRGGQDIALVLDKYAEAMSALKKSGKY